jgi:hypothetical protein
MSLKDVANTLYDWVAGHPPDRAQLLDCAQALESMAMGADQYLFDGWRVQSWRNRLQNIDLYQ